jgi:hypothetical protein
MLQLHRWHRCQTLVHPLTLGFRHLRQLRCERSANPPLCGSATEEQIRRHDAAEIEGAEGAIGEIEGGREVEVEVIPAAQQIFFPDPDKIRVAHHLP